MFCQAVPPLKYSVVAQCLSSSVFLFLPDVSVCGYYLCSSACVWCEAMAVQPCIDVYVCVCVCVNMYKYKRPTWRSHVRQHSLSQFTFSSHRNPKKWEKPILSHLELAPLFHKSVLKCPLCDVTKGSEASPKLDSLPSSCSKSLKSLFFPILMPAFNYSKWLFCCSMICWLAICVNGQLNIAPHEVAGECIDSGNNSKISKVTPWSCRQEAWQLHWRSLKDWRHLAEVHRWHI